MSRETRILIVTLVGMACCYGFVLMSNPFAVFQAVAATGYLIKKQ